MPPKKAADGRKKHEATVLLVDVGPGMLEATAGESSHLDKVWVGSSFNLLCRLKRYSNGS